MKVRLKILVCELERISKEKLSRYLFTDWNQRPARGRRRGKNGKKRPSGSGVEERGRKVVAREAEGSRGMRVPPRRISSRAPGEIRAACIDLYAQ